MEGEPVIFSRIYSYINRSTGDNKLMTYGMLLMPHANARYEEAARPLAQAELMLLLGACGLNGESHFQGISGAQFLCFSADELTPKEMRTLGLHSMLYFIAEIRDDGSFVPLMGRGEAYLQSDLASILKYKGKTNESFTHLLINLALCASGKIGSESPLHVLDPMCGRATTLFDAVNRGYFSTGIDVNQADISEAGNFFARYLKYHHIKHTARDFSMTLPGGKNVFRKQFEFARDAQDYKRADTRTLSLIKGDAAHALNAFKDGTFDIACADLPYGVKHAPKDGARVSGFDELLSSTLPVIFKKLKRGGAVALSFNSYTLKRAHLSEMLSAAGYAPVEGGAYDALEHWVEQAVLRDAVVAIKA